MDDLTSPGVVLLVILYNSTVVLLLILLYCVTELRIGWDKHVVKLYSPSSSCSISIAVVDSRCSLARAMLIAS